MLRCLVIDKRDNITFNHKKLCSLVGSSCLSVLFSLSFSCVEISFIDIHMKPCPLSLLISLPFFLYHDLCPFSILLPLTRVSNPFMTYFAILSLFHRVPLYFTSVRKMTSSLESREPQKSGFEDHQCLHWNNLFHQC